MTRTASSKALLSQLASSSLAGKQKEKSTGAETYNIKPLDSYNKKRKTAAEHARQTRRQRNNVCYLNDSLYLDVSMCVDVL